MKKISVDVAVIGHGTAGAGAFRAAEKEGKTAVIIEGGTYGTTCARVGCMPSKLLISAADSAYEAQHAKVFGVHVTEMKIDGKEVMKRVRDMRDFFVSFVVQGVESIPSEKRIRGMATFIDDNTLHVDDHTEITANSIVIATGSSPFTPDFLQPVQELVQTSDDIFYWDDLPSSIAVFGTGVIALELGQALSRLGVRVTIFGRSGKVGVLEGPGMQKCINSTMLEELDIVRKPEIHSVSKENGSVEITFSDEQNNKRTETYETVLSAAGRTPNTKNLGLENTSIEMQRNSTPVFNRETLQCGTSSIFIAGDAMATHTLLHEASDEGSIAGRNAALFPNVIPLERRVFTSVVFTSPQMAVAGKNYRELNPEEIIVGEVDMTRQGRAQVMAQNKGLIQVYIDKKTRKLVGSEIFSPKAEHFVHLFSWMIAKEATIDELLSMPFYHPTFEEGLRTALRDALAKL